MRRRRKTKYVKERGQFSFDFGVEMVAEIVWHRDESIGKFM